MKVKTTKLESRSYELTLDTETKKKFSEFAEDCRFVHNVFVKIYHKRHKTKKRHFDSYYSNSKLLTIFKKERPDFQHIKRTPSIILQTQLFYLSCCKNKKLLDQDMFMLTRVKFQDNKIWIPKLKKWIEIPNLKSFPVPVKSTRFEQKGDNWYVVLNFD